MPRYANIEHINRESFDTRQTHEAILPPLKQEIIFVLSFRSQASINGEGVTAQYTALAAQTEKGKQLLGATAEVRAEIDQWMTYR